MTKLLKTLIVILFVLAFTAFAMGLMLFRKREVLIGRTLKLEEAIMTVAGTIEAETPGVIARPKYPARDLSEATASFVPQPEWSDFWEHYAGQLELSADSRMDLASRRMQLAQYYKIDPITLRPERDPLSGRKLTEGKGTMQELLDEVVDRSEAQRDRLELTRSQLRSTRTELVETITDLNSSKQELRLALQTIVDRDGTVARLTDTVKARDNRIEELGEEIASLNDTIDRQEFRIEQKDIEIAYLSNDVARLEAKVAALTIPTELGDDPRRIWPTITPGVKGLVVDISRDWNFVVIELSEDFLRQYRAAMETSKSVPDPDFFVMRRSNGDETYVSKVKLLRVNPAVNMGVANILPDWGQDEIRKGDQVRFY